MRKGVAKTAKNKAVDWLHAVPRVSVNDVERERRAAPKKTDAWERKVEQDRGAARRAEKRRDETRREKGERGGVGGFCEHGGVGGGAAGRAVAQHPSFPPAHPRKGAPSRREYLLVIRWPVASPPIYRASLARFARKLHVFRVASRQLRAVLTHFGRVQSLGRERGAREEECSSWKSSSWQRYLVE